MSTEGPFPSMRFQELQKHFSEKHGELDPAALGGGVLVERIDNLDGLLHFILYQLEVAIQRKDLGLIVIDSIAALFRGEFGAAQSVARADALFTLARKLKQLAHVYDLLIVCVNQVAAAFAATGNTQQLVPALGLAWSNCVNTRCSFRRRGRMREMEVVFSPDCPTLSASFVIESKGLVGTMAQPSDRGVED